LSKRLKSPLQMAYCLIRFAIGVIFIGSGGSKLLDPQAFTLIIEAYGLVPEMALWPIAVGLAALELIAGAGLLFDLSRSLETITVLMILFIAILSYGLFLGLDVDCGCFGPNDPEAAAYHGLRPALYRDLVMIGAIGFLFFGRHKIKTRGG
jgi:uncharacterized membrane protein YphA (DoxX/SURF4 family)